MGRRKYGDDVAGEERQRGIRRIKSLYHWGNYHLADAAAGWDSILCGVVLLAKQRQGSCHLGFRSINPAEHDL